MKKIIITVFLTTVLILTSNLSYAQKNRYPVHELSTSLSGGVSNLLYSVTGGGKRSSGIGGSVDIGYIYNIKRNIGIVTGVGVSLYTSKYSIDVLDENYVGEDELYEGYSYTLHSTLTGYSEKHSIALFTVPAMLRYTRGVRSIKYYAAGGLKFGIPLSSRATLSPGVLTTEGEYEYEAGTYRNLPQHGYFTDRALEEVDYNLKLRIVTSLALETGFRFSIGYKKDLQAGVYLDYCPFDVRSTSDRHVVEYQPDHPQFYVFNSVINTNAVKKLSLLNAGIKIGLSF